MIIEKKSDYELLPQERNELRNLLQSSFPGYFESRIYHKQVPTFRLLVKENDRIIGQIGIDYRVISSKRRGELHVLGLIDMCVSESHRKKGIATHLLQTIEQHKGIDAIVTFADDQRLYKKSGYNLADVTCRFLAIEEHKSIAVVENWKGDCFMIKFMKEPLNMQGDYIDMLGYIF